MKTKVILFALFLLAAKATHGQDSNGVVPHGQVPQCLHFSDILKMSDKFPISGNISELEGLTKVYISALPRDQGKRALKVFKKERKNVPFVSVADPNEAELFMQFAFRRCDDCEYKLRDTLQVYYLDKNNRRVYVFTDFNAESSLNASTLKMRTWYDLTRNFFEAYNKSLKQK